MLTLTIKNATARAVAAALFLTVLAGCISQGGSIESRGRFRPVYELDFQEEPVRFLAVEGRGGLSFTLQARPPLRFLAAPVHSVKGGKLIQLAATRSSLNLGYIPPEKPGTGSQPICNIDWVVFGPKDFRRSGTTRIVLEISDDGKLDVLQVVNEVDPK